VGLTDEDVREILRIIDESDLDELRIESDGFSLHVRRGAATAAAPPTAPPPAAPPAPPPEPAAPPAPEDVAPPEKPEPPAADGLVEITSPMLGTFYRAEAPGASPFVEPGSQVEPDTIVCIIEVMKMMNSVPAGVAGQVVEVCSENAELVEYGQTLFRVQPA
jgi:acetyl-CoA carboxylase biotin carboxyl carrier protein